jgi:hypothetical protein
VSHRKLAPATILLACAFWFAFASFANASSVTYTYTGNPFTTIDAPDSCPSQCSIDGSVTFAQALPANLNSMATFTPLSYSFTDGLITITQNNAATGSVFDYFQTDASGMIIGWDIFLESANNQALITTTLGTPLDLSADFNTFGDGFNTDEPGTWTSSASVVPEPESIVLFSSGLAGLIGHLAQRRRNGAPAWASTH